MFYSKTGLKTGLVEGVKHRTILSRPKAKVAGENPTIDIESLEKLL